MPKKPRQMHMAIATVIGPFLKPRSTLAQKQPIGGLLTLMVRDFIERGKQAWENTLAINFVARTHNYFGRPS
jgi:hypothetical protein